MSVVPRPEIYEYAGFMFDIVRLNGKVVSMTAHAGQHPAAYKMKHAENALEQYRQEHPNA